MEALFAFIKRYNYVFVFLLLEIFSIVFITQNSNYQGSKIVQAGNAVAGLFRYIKLRFLYQDLYQTQAVLLLCSLELAVLRLSKNISRGLFA